MTSPDKPESQMFGPPPPESVYWSQPTPGATPAQPGQGVQAGRETKMSENATLKLDQGYESTILGLPGLAPALLEHGRKLAAAATTNAQVAGAEYKAVLSVDANGHPQVHVVTANPEAEFDEAAHSTLTAAMTTAAAQAQDGQ